jgi:hypothetical protein
MAAGPVYTAGGSAFQRSSSSSNELNSDQGLGAVQLQLLLQQQQSTDTKVAGAVQAHAAVAGRPWIAAGPVYTAGGSAVQLSNNGKEINEAATINTNNHL